MQIEGIIFDLDGTLIHTIDDIAGAANVMFSRNGLPTHDVPYYLKWIGSGAIKLIERALGAEVDRKQLMEYVAAVTKLMPGKTVKSALIFSGGMLVET